MDMIWFTLKSMWCAITGCYQCVDYTVPRLVLPEYFYIDKTFNEAPKMGSGAKWKGKLPETYRYKAERNSLTYKIVGPAEQYNGHLGAYALTVSTQDGIPVKVQEAWRLGPVKPGYESSREERSRRFLHQLDGRFKSNSHEVFEVGIIPAVSREYVSYTVKFLGEKYQSEEPFDIQVKSYDVYPGAYCFSDFR